MRLIEAIAVRRKAYGVRHKRLKRGKGALMGGDLARGGSGSAGEPCRGLVDRALVRPAPAGGGLVGADRPCRARPICAPRTDRGGEF